MVLAALPTVAAWTGGGAGRPIRLNLGPGDGPYVSGFTPAWEFEDGVSTHWTTYDARVRLPLEVRGGATVRYRFSRVLPETAVVEAVASGAVLDRFECRGGAVLEREVRLSGAAPLALAFRVDSHDRRNLGLRLDWIDWVPEANAVFRLQGGARGRGGLTIALIFLLLVAAGWNRGPASGAAAGLAVAAAVACRWDPWLFHRLLTGIPETLALAGGTGVALGVWLKRRGTASPDAVRSLTALALAAFLLRALPLNHPDFYYPDIHSHARFAQGLAEMGPGAFLDPVRFVREHGIWKTEYFESELVFPYSPAFHALFAWWPLSYDGLSTAMKLGAALLTLVPLVLTWRLAGAFGASPLAATVLMAAIPTYATRLGFAFFPALFGHAVDMAAFTWLAARTRNPWSPPAFAAAALAVAAAQLAYVSGVMNISLFMGGCALAEAAVGRGPDRHRRGGLILAVGLAGSGIAVLLYYRSFLLHAFDLLPRLAAGGGDGRYPVRGVVEVALERTIGFFGFVLPVMAILALPALLRGPGRAMILAWGATYAVLLAGRARVPDVFLHGHETLFLTPLACLAAGHGLVLLNERGSWGKPASWAFGGWLVLEGLWRGWWGIASHFGRAG